MFIENPDLAGAGLVDPYSGAYLFDSNTLEDLLGFLSRKGSESEAFGSIEPAVGANVLSSENRDALGLLELLFCAKGLSLGLEGLAIPGKALVESFILNKPPISSDWLSLGLPNSNLLLMLGFGLSSKSPAGYLLVAKLGVIEPGAGSSDAGGGLGLVSAVNPTSIVAVGLTIGAICLGTLSAGILGILIPRVFSRAFSLA